MARTLKAIMYEKLTSFKNDVELKKAIRAVNARIRRVKKSGDYSKLSKTLSYYEKMMFDITRGNLKGNYNKKMFTKSGLVSTGISKLKTNEKKALSDFVLKLMKADDFTVPELKKIAKTKATLLGTSVEEYMKRVEFWKLFRQVKEDSIYGSDETYNAVDIVLNQPTTYEEKVKRAEDILESMGVGFEESGGVPPEIPKDGKDVYSYDELINLINKTVTSADYDKYTTGNKK